MTSDCAVLFVCIDGLMTAVSMCWEGGGGVGIVHHGVCVYEHSVSMFFFLL